jgi:hypothetical protein
MKKPSVYISCPLAIPESTHQLLIKTINSTCIANNVICEWWVRGTKYNESLLTDANVFVLILPDNQFECEFEHLPIGCKKELEKVRSLNKRIFIGYFSKMANKYCVYDAGFTLTTIFGIPGTSNSFFGYLYRLRKDIITSDVETIDSSTLSECVTVKQLNHRVLLL